MVRLSFKEVENPYATSFVTSKQYETQNIGRFSTLPSGTIGAFKDFKISVPNEVLEKSLTLFRKSPIAEATYESTCLDRSSE